MTAILSLSPLFTLIFSGMQFRIKCFFFISVSNRRINNFSIWFLLKLNLHDAFFFLKLKTVSVSVSLYIDKVNCKCEKMKFESIDRLHANRHWRVNLFSFLLTWEKIGLSLYQFPSHNHWKMGKKIEVCREREKCDLRCKLMPILIISGISGETNRKMNTKIFARIWWKYFE